MLRRQRRSELRPARVRRAAHYPLQRDGHRARVAAAQQLEVRILGGAVEAAGLASLALRGRVLPALVAAVDPERQLGPRHPVLHDLVRELEVEHVQVALRVP